MAYVIVFVAFYAFMAGVLAAFCEAAWRQDVSAHPEWDDRLFFLLVGILWPLAFLVRFVVGKK